VLVTGGARRGTLLRVVGADGADVLDDSAGGGTRFSGSLSSHRVAAGPGTRWDRRPYVPPAPGKGAEWVPARDFGRLTGPLLQVSYGSDYGALLGASLQTVGYGFRKDPWADKQSLKVVYATEAASFRGTYLGQFRFENSPFRIGVAALASGIETGHFFGSGNATTYEGSDDAYQIEQDRFELEAGLVYGPSDHLDLSLGPVVRYDRTEPGENPVLGAQPFYGEGSFTQLGLSARVRYDATGRLGLPREGVLFTGTARYYPALVDVTEAFGEVHGDVRGYLSTPGVKGLTLAMRAGGQKVFGTYPFFESAFIGGQTPFGLFEPGGGSSVRGLPPQRYAGDASLYGGAEVYLPLLRAFLFMHGHIGVMGFFDAGRVWLEGESANGWHHGAGGGLFFTTPGRRSIASLQLATSEGKTALYLRTTLAF
jgi:outer membrane protein assembly factor BamA